MNSKNIGRIFLVVILGSFLSISCSGDNGSGPSIELSITQGPTSVVEYTSARIVWETNLRSSAIVHYGSQSGQLDQSVVGSSGLTDHEVAITGLTSNTSYYFSVESKADEQNIASQEVQFLTLKTIANHMADGWQAFQDGDYLLAIAEFKGAIAQNQPGAKHDAYNGLGWSYAANSVDSLGLAVLNFDTSIQQNINFDEAYAGRGFVHLAQKLYISALNDLTKALQLDSDFVFSRNPNIDAMDVRLGLAEIYFFRQDFENAQTQIDTIDPANGLDPNNSSSWNVDSTDYSTYVEALLATIEKLKSSV